MKAVRVSCSLVESTSVSLRGQCYVFELFLSPFVYFGTDVSGHQSQTATLTFYLEAGNNPSGPE